MVVDVEVPELTGNEEKDINNLRDTLLQLIENVDYIIRRLENNAD